ncbi:c-type cytochrome [Formosa sp. PL04]|uniref:c-type cytochrome n=1 Tax=Formosa sp. PL04 TaxID=3081755 RepID=UPI002982B6B3|nr:c-type cytochrome [Formosa sp. PL04]MDW5289802.1 c-type cytochrome [Formosa sp. PL04]
MKTNRVSLILTTLLIALFLTSCIDGIKKESTPQFIHPDLYIEHSDRSASKGIGYVKEVKLTDSLNDVFVEKGKFIFENKCSSCHKLTDQRLVGPGWTGITNSRRPEWIMNMITNTNEMLEKDEDAKNLLDDCLTRMPNQYVSTAEARTILEFMRKNDMDQVQRKDGAVTTENY